MDQQLEKLKSRHQAYKAAGLALDLTRGKPAPDQLDLSDKLDGILGGAYLLSDGTDVRNYGGILGIPQARALGGEIMDVPAAQVLAGGNSSLTLMYQYVAHMMETWIVETAVTDNAVTDNNRLKFLCPVPGYDRHFTICEHFDIEMINVALLDGGPDMDQVEALVKADPLIKGIWCVPKYSNPTGHTYSDETVSRLAKLPGMAGNHFRVIWDNAYVVHHLTDQPDKLSNIMVAATQTGVATNEDGIVLFASTSKITFAGAGVAFMAASAASLKSFEQYLGAQVIGFDKVNQLRHALFLKDAQAIATHMDKHKALIKPKFDLVEAKLSNALGNKNIAHWTSPRGGYFVSLETRPGLARRVVQLAAEAGVKLTPAGATFPYGRDPNDSNIRISPTYPSIADLDQAMDVLVTCVELATLEDPMRS